MRPGVTKEMQPSLEILLTEKGRKRQILNIFSLLIVCSPQYFSLTEFTLKSEEKGPENVSPFNTARQRRVGE